MTDGIGTAIFVLAVGVAVLGVLAAALFGGDVGQSMELATGTIKFGFILAVIVILGGAVVGAAS